MTVYIRHGDVPTADEWDDILDDKDEGTHSFLGLITPPEGTSGMFYVGVQGSTSLRAPCQFTLKVEWGPGLCTIPTNELSFCNMVDYPVINEDLTARDAMELKDQFVRFLYNSRVQGNESVVCLQAMKTFLCASTFRKCDVGGYAQLPCRSMCESFAGTCDFDPKAFDPRVFDPTKPGCNQDSEYADWPACGLMPLTIEHAAHKVDNRETVVSSVVKNTLEHFTFAVKDPSSYIIVVEPHGCSMKDALLVKALHDSPPDEENYDFEIQTANEEGRYVKLATPPKLHGTSVFLSVQGAPTLKGSCEFSVRASWGPQLCAIPHNLTFCDTVNFPVLNEDHAYEHGMDVKDAFLAFKFQATVDRYALTDLECQRQLKRYLCSTGLHQCDATGYPTTTCQGVCFDFANACGFNPFGEYVELNPGSPGCSNTEVYSNDEDCTDAGVVRQVPLPPAPQNETLPPPEPQIVEKEVCEPLPLKPKKKTEPPKKCVESLAKKLQLEGDVHSRNVPETQGLVSPVDHGNNVEGEELQDESFDTFRGIHREGDGGLTTTAPTPTILQSGKPAFDFVAPRDVRVFAFDVEPSSIIVNVKPIHCEGLDPLDVYLRRGEVATTDEYDRKLLAPEFGGNYDKVIVLDKEEGGRYFLSVVGSAVHDECRFEVVVTWGRLACAVPTTLEFCHLVGYSTANEDLAQEHGMQLKDEFARMRFTSSSKTSRSPACEEAMTRFLCAYTFPACSATGLALKPCRRLCDEYTAACGVNPHGYKPFDLEAPGCDTDAFDDTNCTTLQ
eukprot:TRINITY_DN35764_c0_g1_i1.p1 TRINITY_DN35764_c0_g1~~TRINITY_DN35764_c0_g1_i1.p1  ORF type:complete len:878 (+),score=204.33 TRINITY_DN35764_c0_g1_i1:286-2634(+)